ncbi:hypothetical protein GCM10028810_58500 [Spirosoma litoris]|jgi:hypothetical protein
MELALMESAPATRSPRVSHSFLVWTPEQLTAGNKNSGWVFREVVAFDTMCSLGSRPKLDRGSLLRRYKWSG